MHCKTMTLRAACACSAALVGALLAGAAGSAQAADVVMPPMSVRTAQYFKENPDARARFVAQLPHRVPGAVPTAHRIRTTTGGTWQTVTAASSSAGLGSPLLLQDGRILVASINTPDWYTLTPDSSGNYADGTWTQVASLPVIGGTQYAPLYHASAVLPDGRVIIMGGEYNGSNTEVWTNLGAIYDPVANSWTAVPAPSGSSWTQIGDAESVVLPNGTFMLASCCAYNPDADALLNAGTLAWTATNAPNGGLPYQDEQGYELLPDGKVLTIDIWTNYLNQGNAVDTQIYDPTAGTWSAGPNTPVSLADPYACGTFEIGPAVLRGTGSLVAFGGHTDCSAAPGEDPTAVYNTKKNSWKLGPKIPSVCGSNGTTPCDLADAPAALEPDGYILFAASAGFGGQPTHFFEFTPNNKIQQVSDPVDNASSSGAYYYNLLLLPNGQVLMTDFSNIAEVYTPAGSAIAGWAPKVQAVSTTLKPGKTYGIGGNQLNGVSQGAYYGDDAQMASNYPIVRITNTASGNVVYARTTNPSTMTVTPKAKGTARFTVPSGTETGASTLSVVANGIASAPVIVTIK